LDAPRILWALYKLCFANERKRKERKDEELFHG